MPYRCTTAPPCQSTSMVKAIIWRMVRKVEFWEEWMTALVARTFIKRSSRWRQTWMTYKLTATWAATQSSADDGRPSDDTLRSPVAARWYPPVTCCCYTHRGHTQVTERTYEGRCWSYLPWIQTWPTFKDIFSRYLSAIFFPLSFTSPLYVIHLSCLGSEQPQSWHGLCHAPKIFYFINYALNHYQVGTHNN